MEREIIFMVRRYPCVEVDLKKVTHNARKIMTLCNKNDIDVVGVTKVFCAELPVVQAVLNSGINMIGDSRILNLKKMEGLNCKKMLLRIPMKDQAYEVVKYSDISLNSELNVIGELSRVAKMLNTVHNIILMVDVGDLREGVLIKDVIDIVKEIIKFENIRLVGLGTNVTCYGGVIPDENNLGKLVKLRDKVMEIFDIDLPIISGGNSSSLYMAAGGTVPKGINQLRIGEGIVLGRETSFGHKISGCYSDAFVLKSEIIEIKDKPTVPVGKIGVDAFGEKPRFKDKGIRKRAIAAVGRQDIKLDGLSPLNKNIDIFGASSDHLILDITESEKPLKVGDVIVLNMDYGCILAAMTSPYVNKYYSA
jgi:predicted amino acid racemase